MKSSLFSVALIVAVIPSIAASDRNTDDDKPKVFKKAPRIASRNLASSNQMPTVNALAFKLGEEAYIEACCLEGDDEKASFEKLQEAANYGHVESQLKVGMAYLYGAFGVRKDPHYAQKYLKWAADSGNDEAQVILGACYLGLNDDDGCVRMPRSDLFGLKYLKSSLKQENISAALFLIQYYIDKEQFDKAFQIIQLPFVEASDDESIQEMKDILDGIKQVL